MRTLGISLAWILLSGSLLTPLGVLSAFATSQTVPLPPTALNATAVSGTKIFLMWAAPINGTQSGVSGYKIETSPSCSGSFNFLANTTSTTFLSTGLANGTCYQYRVSAINSIGISSPSNIATATTLSAPSAPTNLAASAVSSSQINLNWNTPNNNGGTIITGYKIERRNACAGNFLVIANTGNASTTYSDAGLSSNTCYQYTVYANNAIGASVASNNVTAITKPATTQIHVPSAPTGLSVTALSATSLKLTWNAPSDNGGAAISGYLIQRNGTIIVNDTFTNQTIYVDTNLVPLHKQTYQVAAWNSAGLSPLSSSAAATTLNTTGSITTTSGNQTGILSSASNLGQLVSDFVHKRNAILKQQRAEIINVIHQCHAKIKSASSQDRKQIQDDCKEKIKEIREKYKDLQKQLKQELEQLKAQFKSEVQQEHKQQEVEEKNETRNFDKQVASIGEKTHNFGNGAGKHEENHHSQGKHNHANN